nr:immunoglobulin light chain junction region [Macaca mulatta]MOV66608.1 immunoglobulin light chain junction region [Macaca mulatta]MOV68137.1 immunoglobulin light chain junction region [Macaca mulatta]MOV96912.1 immunoglobulin light chain junction region [Macaca mulatta]MOV98200.1 immunoglobulin light chain junction region [Macaca mulatta]
DYYCCSYTTSSTWVF